LEERGLLQQSNHSQKQWLKSSEVRKMLSISRRTSSWQHGALINGNPILKIMSIVMNSNPTSFLSF
jgi:hypothetical protein